MSDYEKIILLDLNNDLIARVKASGGYIGMEIFSPAIEQINGGWIPAMYLKVIGIEDARKIVDALQQVIQSAEEFESLTESEKNKLRTPF